MREKKRSGATRTDSKKMSHLDNPDYDGYETMGGYTDGEYNGGMAESSADYGGGITQGENQRYRNCGLYVFL